MEGIQIDTSLGKSAEELSSLTQENNEVQATEETSQETQVEASTEVESKVEETSEQVQSTEASQSTKVEEQVSDVDETLIRSKAEEFGYISNDDLEARINEARQEWENSAPQTEESDFIKKIKELESQGYNVNDSSYWSLVTKDYNRYDLNDINQALDVVLEGYKLEYPNVSEDVLRQKLENDYDALYGDEFEPEDREYKKAKANLSVNAPTYLNKLKEQQSKAKPTIKEEAKAALDAQMEQKRFEQILPKAEREYNNKINKYLNENSSYEVKVGDDSVQYELSKSEMGQLSESLNQIFKKDYKSLIDENGSIESRVKDEGIAITVENLIWMNPELRSGILNKMKDNISATVEKKLVKDLDNTTMPETQAGSVKNEKDPNAESWSKVGTLRTLR